MHKILFAATCSELWQRERQSGIETCEKSLCLVALGRELKEQLTGSLCWVIPHTEEVIFIRQSDTLQVELAWGEAIAFPTGITPPYPVELKLGCWGIQLEPISESKANRKVVGTVLWELWILCWPSSGHSAGKSLPWWASSLLYTPNPAEGSTNYGSLIVPNRLSRANCSSVWQRPEQESLQIYPLHRNKNREAAKMEDNKWKNKRIPQKKN